MITIDELKNKITKKSRLLGLDLGSKRIGVAICDHTQSIATPFITINKENNIKLIEQLKLIIDERILYIKQFLNLFLASNNFSSNFLLYSLGSLFKSMPLNIRIPKPMISLTLFSSVSSSIFDIVVLFDLIFCK